MNIQPTMLVNLEIFLIIRIYNFMYLFYMILIQCKLTNVCYLIFLTQIWMTIRLQSDLDPDEATKDLLDCRIILKTR